MKKARVCHLNKNCADSRKICLLRFLRQLFQFLALNSSYFVCSASFRSFLTRYHPIQRLFRNMSEQECGEIRWQFS